ncbi:DUF2225 domain-containing protein [Paenibacillus sp. MBLB4367]|uniref:DUF2225 domain-containing protein n=1 Tax=Paenibacillus sp. MBLB4367 TaxID=3384767 RepID=UPI003908156E
MTAVEPLFQTQVTCMYCESVFESSRVRPSFKKPSGSDTDFYLRYKEVNPDYYVVKVCPVCGFASTENFSDRFTASQRKTFEERVRSNWSMRDYGGKRGWDEAMQTFKLALLCAQIKQEKDRIIAGMLHHIAWLWREKGDREQEQRFLEHALSAYVKVYETEGADVNNARLMYLIGELSRRTGQYKDAVLWFGRVINDKKIMDSAMIRASREQWVATREDMIEAQMELPDEMKQNTK